MNYKENISTIGNKLSQGLAPGGDNTLNFFEGDGFKGYGPLGLEKSTADNAVGIFAKFISSVIGLITIVGIIWFIINFITGAVSIILSAGDKGGLEAARKKMFSSLIGLVILVFALLIINALGALFGINDILSIQSMFKTILIQ